MKRRDARLGEKVGMGTGRMSRRLVASSLDIAINILAPIALYMLLRDRHGEVGALLVSSTPPLAWAALSLARTGSVDGLSILSLAAAALSLLLLTGGGSGRMLLLREHLVTLLVGLAFLGSAAIGRPLIMPLARAMMARGSAAERDDFEARRGGPEIRHTVMVMTIVWGAGLVASFAAAVVLIETATVARAVATSAVLGWGSYAALGAWTLIYKRRRQRYVTRQMLTAPGPLPRGRLRPEDVEHAVEPLMPRTTADQDRPAAVAAAPVRRLPWPRATPPVAGRAGRADP